MVAILMFLIAASIVVNVHACDMKLHSPGRLRNEANHTAHDPPGVEAFICGLRSSFNLGSGIWNKKR